MNLVCTPYPKEPKELDIYCDDFWTNNFGPLHVILKNDKGELKGYPLSWLDENDIKLTGMKGKISGDGLPKYIFPIGKIVLINEKLEIKLYSYRNLS